MSQITNKFNKNAFATQKLSISYLKILPENRACEDCLGAWYFVPMEFILLVQHQRSVKQDTQLITN